MGIINKIRQACDSLSASLHVPCRGFSDLDSFLVQSLVDHQLR